MMTGWAWMYWCLFLILAPLWPGLINKTKAWFAGRCGASIWQLYRDLAKLLGKGVVYSTTTTAVFRWGPIVSLATVILASLLLPVAGRSAVGGFTGDMILMIYLLGLGRFMTVLAAMDTGSSFEGMGASREVWLGAVAEPVLFVVLAALVRGSGQGSLGGMFGVIDGAYWLDAGAGLLFCGAALVVIVLVECARIPVDDPNTHLELTMIHEVMILDHSGPDLALIEYGSALKMALLGGLLVNLMPWHGWPPGVQGLLLMVALGVLSIALGALESSIARIKLPRLSHLLAGALALALCGLFLMWEVAHA